MSDLIAQVEAQTGLAAAEQSLSFAASSLDATPGSALLSSVGIVDGSTVYLSVASTCADCVVHVSLPAALSSTPSGLHSPSAAVPLPTLFRLLKAKVEGVTGLQVPFQALSLGSTMLVADSLPLGSYGVECGSTLDLLLQKTQVAVVHVALPPTLQRPQYSTLTFALTSLDMVSDLRANIEAQAGLPAVEQSLQFGATEIDAAPGIALLSTFGVVNNSIIYLKLKPPLSTADEIVYVKSLHHTSPSVVAALHVALPPLLRPSHGTTLTLGLVLSSDSVSDLKMEIEMNTGLVIAEQSLSFEASSMDTTLGTTLLRSFGIVNGSTVYLSAIFFVVHVSLPASLSSTYGLTLTFIGGSASDLVSSLEAKVESVTNVLPEVQVLSLGSTVLEAGSSPLSTYDVATDSTVALTLTTAPPYVAAVVHVALPISLQSSHSTLTFSLSSSTDTVSDLKMKVQAQTALPASEQSLSFAASLIRSAVGTELLSSFGVVDGSVIYIELMSESTFVLHVSLPALLSSTFGPTLTFRTGSMSDLVASLKAKVESVTCVPAAVQVLSLGSTVLVANTSTVGSYGVVSGSTVVLMLPEDPAAVFYHVALPRVFQPSLGTTLTFVYDSKVDTVSDLKANMKAHTGLAFTEQSLSFAASFLDAATGTTLLSSFGIIGGSIIYLSLESSWVGFVVHLSLPVPLNNTLGPTLAFRGGSASDLVSSLEAKVESVTGVPAAIQVLSLGSTSLAANTLSLSSYGVVSGSVITLTLPWEPATEVIHVALPLSLQPLYGALTSFSFTGSSDAMSDLRAKIEAQTGLAAVEQSLTFSATSLDATPGSALLSSVGIVDGSTIYLSVALSSAFVVHVSLPASLSSTFGSTLTFRGGISVQPSRLSGGQGGERDGCAGWNPGAVV